MKTVLVRIHGKVQGVWYRAWTITNATELGLNGWVRNRSDGTVEAVFSGEDDIVGEMLRRCEDGPELAVVHHIDVSSTEEVVSKGFEKRDTF